MIDSNYFNPQSDSKLFHRATNIAKIPHRYKFPPRFSRKNPQKYRISPPRKLKIPACNEAGISGEESSPQLIVLLIIKSTHHTQNILEVV